MQSLLIATSDQSMTTILTHTLQHKYIIHTCANPEYLPAMLEKQKPTVLIADIHFVYIPVQQQFLSLLYPVTTIVLTNYTDDHLEQCAANAGIQSVLRIPCTPEYIASAIENAENKCPARHI